LLSPDSHGNTDPVFVAFTLLSLYTLVAGRSATLAGVSFAAALSVKIVPIVVLPLLLFVAARAGWRRLAHFLIGAGTVLALLWGPVIVTNWAAYRHDVLEYAGIDRRPWGIIQFANWAALPDAGVEWLIGPGRFLVVTISAIVPVLIAWRRSDATKAAGMSLVLLLLLSTASATQYLAWAAAAALLVSVSAGTIYNVTAGAFLIFAYDRWNGNVPPWRWDLANVTDWTTAEVQFAAVVWLTLLAVAIVGALPTRSWSARLVLAPTDSELPAAAQTGSASAATKINSLSATEEDDAVPKATASYPSQYTVTDVGNPARTPRIGILVVAYNAATTLAKTLVSDPARVPAPDH
jgi:hypothetical protein